MNSNSVFSPDKGSPVNDNIPDISSLKSNLKIRPAELARIQVMHNQYVRDLWISTVEAVNTASKVAKYPNGINILRLTNVVEWKNLLKHLAQKHPDVAATGERNVPGVVEGRTGPKPGEIQGGSGTRMENLKIVNADIKKLIAGIKSKNLQINDIDQLVNYSNKSFGSPENRKALLESFKDIVQFAEKYGYNFAENFKLPNDFTSAYKTILTIRDSIYRNLELLNGINYKNPDQRTIIMKAYSTFFEFKEFAAKPTKEQYAEMLSKFQKALQNYLAPKEAGELLGRLMLEKRFSTQSHETPVDFTNIEIPTKAQPTMEQIANMAVVLRNFEKIPVKLRQQYSAEKLYETVLKTVQDRNLSGSQKKLIFEKIKEYKEQQKIALDVVNSPREKQLQFIKDTIKKEIGAADVVLPDDFSFKIKYIENADGVPQMHITVPPEVFIQMSKQIKNWQTLTKLQKTKLIEKTTTIGENIDAYNKLISFYRSDRSVKAGPRIHETAHASLGLLGMRRQYNKITENISPESKGYPEFISRTITGDYHLAGDEIVAHLKAGISHSADPVKFAQEIKSHLSLKYLRKWSDNIHETYVRSNSGNLPREVQLQRLELNKKYFEKLQQSVDTAVDMAVKIAAFQNGYNMLKLTPVNRWGELLTHLNNEKLSTTGRLEQPFHSNLPEANSFKYNNITFSETNLPKTYKGLMEVDIKHPGLLDKLGINTPEALKVFETYKEYVRSLERKIQDSIDKSKPDYATLSEIMRNVGAKSNATGSKIADLKSIVRSTEKVIEDKGKIEKLLDIVRGTLVFDRHADVYTALQSLTSNPLVDRIFMKDKFGIRDANGNFNLENPAPVENGFRNLHLNIRLKNGHVVELQLQIKEMALVNGELPVPVEKLKAANPFDANEKEAAKNIAQRIEKPNIVLPDITQPGVKPNSHELFEIFRSCNENVIIEKELKAKILKVLTILHNHAWDTYKERSSK